MHLEVLIYLMKNGSSERVRDLTEVPPPVGGRGRWGPKAGEASMLFDARTRVWGCW